MNLALQKRRFNAIFYNETHTPRASKKADLGEKSSKGQARKQSGRRGRSSPCKIFRLPGKLCWT